jgi:hypothetical protein
MLGVVPMHLGILSAKDQSNEKRKLTKWFAPCRGMNQISRTNRQIEGKPRVAALVKIDLDDDQMNIHTTDKWDGSPAV